jgi:hypothetical protein
MDADDELEYSKLARQNNSIEKLRKKLSDHASKCADILSKLLVLCKLVMYSELKSTEEATNLLREGVEEQAKTCRSITDIFTLSIMPYFEILKRNFYPSDPSDSIPSWQMPLDKVYTIIHVSLIMFYKNLSTLRSNICEATEDLRKSLNSIYEEIGLNNLERSLMLINNKAKLNNLIGTKEEKIQTPIGLMDVYSRHLITKLKGSNFDQATKVVDEIKTSLTKLTSNSSHYLFSDLCEIKDIYIPSPIHDLVPFSESTSLLSKMFSSSCAGAYSIVVSGDDQEEVKKNKQEPIDLSNYSLECNKSLNEVIESLSDELNKLSNQFNCSYLDEEIQSELIIKLDQNMKELYRKLEKVFRMCQNYVQDNKIKEEQELNEILEDFEANNISSCTDQNTLTHLHYMPLIAKLIGEIDRFIFDVDKRIATLNILNIDILNLQLIEKSILKYNTEIIMRQDVLLINFFKIEWIEMFMHLVFNDIFDDLLVRLNENIDKSLMPIIGTINIRTVAQFVYADKHSFFNNQNLITQIEKNYYTSISKGLGSLIQRVLFNMNECKKKIKPGDQMSKINIIEDEKSKAQRILLEKSSKSDDSCLCFCSYEVNNRPVNVIQSTLDYIILTNLIKYSLDGSSNTINKILEFLQSEIASNLTHVIYSRWLLWLCMFVGNIQNKNFDAKLRIRLSRDQFPLLEQCLRKHLRGLKYLQAMNDDSKQNEIINGVSFEVELFRRVESVKTDLKRTEIKQYLENPNAFPIKSDFFTSNESNSLRKYSLEFNTTDPYKKIITIMAIMNKLRHLGNTLLYNYDEFIFTPVEIDSTSVEFYFD